MSSISAGLSDGTALVSTGDTTGELVLKTNGGTTAVTIGTDQSVTFAAGVVTTSPTVLPAGTASAPALTTTGDTNTGLFFPAADTIAFSEGGAEAMRIDSDGDVGIGTTAPVSKLNVMGAASGGGKLFIDTNGAFAGTDTATLGFSIFQDGGRQNSQAEIRCIGDGNYSGHLAFFTQAPGTYPNTVSERMRITSGGNLLVGTTTAAATAKVESYKTGASTTCFLATQGDSGDYCYTSRAFNNGGVYYHFNFTEAGTQRGSITSNGSATAYNTSSDYRLKENIAPMVGALNVIAQLKPSTFTWKSTGKQSQGFIAHELADVVPDCVTGEKDAVETYTDEKGNEQTRPVYQGIDTSFLVATLTAAIQELSAKNDALEARIAALEGAQA